MAESFKKVFQQSKTVLNNPPDLHESQVKVIQSKMEELENQFKFWTSLLVMQALRILKTHLV